MDVCQRARRHVRAGKAPAGVRRRNGSTQASGTSRVASFLKHPQLRAVSENCDNECSVILKP